jgi:16S rRNA (guanine966-N2)-methyltransferase
VFLDPPYGMGLAERALISAGAGSWLLPDAHIVVEEATGAFQTPEDLDEVERRAYDDTELIFARRQ